MLEAAEIMSRRHRSRKNYNYTPQFDSQETASKLLGALKDREAILAKEELYRSELDWFHSGSWFCGRLPMPIGFILELWQESPMFTLPDGRKIFQYSGGLSGVCRGWAVDTETGEISSFHSDAEHKICFQDLWHEAARIWIRDPKRGPYSVENYNQ